MRPKQLLVRCYAKREGNLWVGFCLDFSLAAQADTLAEVKQKLDDQIREYVHDALAGDEREHAEYLLSRRAPFSYWCEYWAIKAAFYLSRRLHASKPVEQRLRPFKEILPMVPAIC